MSMTTEGTMKFIEVLAEGTGAIIADDRVRLARHRLEVVRAMVRICERQLAQAEEDAFAADARQQAAIDAFKAEPAAESILAAVEKAEGREC
ncbi:MAG TPA: hypothetical protein VNQ78_19350 [Paracoccus sp. (in: a-proteobacteria)]|uniref:hypothetical protein n=1 Tax=Paracoccus sp. TaxID=267 RepID=UPI002B832380|nr:hypothetical protein [Paracoccus sp. (in: a-proteobacteria)]HWL58813.1 hypothetical protein [Paracoccus sp. (in: a-proteobacteria)]